jgi:hypothetical protein
MQIDFSDPMDLSKDYTYISPFFTVEVNCAPTGLLTLSAKSSSTRYITENPLTYTFINILTLIRQVKISLKTFYYLLIQTDTEVFLMAAVMIKDSKITSLPLHFYAIFRTHRNQWYVNTDNGIIHIDNIGRSQEEIDASADFQKSLLVAALFKLEVAETTNSVLTKFGPAKNSIAHLLAT